mgnify:FL=1
MDIFVDKKFCTNEYQKYAYAYLQVSETVGHSSKQEEHRTQTENGEDIREEHHIRVERNGEDGWDAIESEHKIAKFYEQHRNEQWGYKPLAATRLIGFYNLVVCSFLGAYKEFAAEEIMRYATKL